MVVLVIVPADANGAFDTDKLNPKPAFFEINLIVPKAGLVATALTINEGPCPK